MNDRIKTLIGVAGESASGKTTFCAHLLERFPPGLIAILSLDAYYRSQVHLPADQREQVNFDHPDVFDYSLLIEHVDKLRLGLAIDVPVYDFTSHTRMDRTIRMTPAPVIIIEGILALYWKELRTRFDFKVFIDVPEDIRLQRRIDRDTRERGRSRESVIQQWETSVVPMSRAFCAPTKQFADWIFRGDILDNTSFAPILAQIPYLASSTV